MVRSPVGTSTEIGEEEGDEALHQKGGSGLEEGG